jgi:type IV secretory pathway VirB10-like protein
MDLYTIPTHMHVVDRLMDLHTRARRTTVIRANHGGANNGTGGEKEQEPMAPVKDKKPLEPAPPLIPAGSMAIGGTPSVKSPRPNPKQDSAIKALKEEVAGLKAETKRLKDALAAASKEGKLVEAGAQEARAEATKVALVAKAAEEAASKAQADAQAVTAGLERALKDKDAQLVQKDIELALKEEASDALRSALEGAKADLDALREVDASARAEEVATFGLTR